MVVHFLLEILWIYLSAFHSCEFIFFSPASLCLLLQILPGRVGRGFRIRARAFLETHHTSGNSFFLLKVKSEKARLDTSNLPDLHFPLWRFQIAWIVFPWEEDWHLVKFNPGRRGAGFCTWNTSGPTQCTQQCSIQSNERKVKREINLLRPQSCQQIFCNDLKCFRQPSMILRHGSKLFPPNSTQPTGIVLGKAKG